MKSRLWLVCAVCVALALVFTGLPWALESLAPRTGLQRSYFAQPAFAGPPIESRTSNIDLAFLDQRPDLPRQHFSARWRGYFFVASPQTIELFAGGNDEVQLRVDGELLITRNLREGLRTIGKTLAVDAGSHRIDVDYQQFTGGMALNIQRALAGEMPSPFLGAELFSEPADAHHVRMLAAARGMRQAIPFVWLTVVVTLVVSAAAANFDRLRALPGTPRTVREYIGRVSLVAAPAALAPVVVFFMGPHTIFTNNPGEFAVTFGRLAWPWLVRAAVVNWLAAFAIGCVLALVSKRATRIYGAVLFAFGLLVWGQGNLWNADYGVLAGRDVDLAEHAARAPYEVAAFAAGLVLAAIFFRPISRIAPFATLAFVAVQAIGAVAIGTGPAAQTPRWIDPPAQIYGFSPQRNVIHIVLDEFQSDVFTEILNQDRALFDQKFSGFTYFADHAAAFPTTSMSMPAMLTGLEYRNERHAPEFIRDAFEQSSVFAKVSAAGYDVDAMSIIRVASFEDWLGTDAAPHWKGWRFRIRKPFISQVDYREVTARQLAELSMFRHAPHTVKAFSVERPETFYRPIVMNRGDSPAQIRRHEASNSAAFFEQFIATMAVNRDRPVYKLLHVGVPHRPIVVDRDCRFIGATEMSRDSYREQSRCAVALTMALVDRARALGIYDSSLIIVSSDHGTDLNPLGFNGRSDSLSLVPGPSTSRLPAIVGSAKAIMFIKPPWRGGPVVISNAPTTHIDLQSTILDVLELPGGSPDMSMLRRNEKQPRTRIYGMYDPRQRFPSEHLDRLDVLSIDGRVIDAASWNVQRSIWTPRARLDSRDIDVGPREAHRYLGPGWTFEERERESDVTFARAVTPRAVLFASLPARAVEVVLRASSSPGPAPESIRVTVDGRDVATLKAPGDGYADLPVRIPADAERPHVSEITLHLLGGSDPVALFKLDRIVIR